MAKKAATAEGGNKYNQRRWAIPSKRAKNYAAERRAKVHQRGPKEGKELTDYEAGIRSGYLQAQTDHAGLYKYKKAISEGKSKAEASEISQRKSK
mgnify:CR=1 FL=1